MLEKILSKTVFMILERLVLWAAQEVKVYLQKLDEDRRDREALEKLKQAQDKQKKLQNAKDLVDSATRPMAK